MRTIKRRATAAGVTQWIFLDRNKPDFNVRLDFQISSGAVLTASVQHTIDMLWPKRAVRITRSTTTATVTDAAHGLAAGDYIAVENAGAPFDGEYSVASVVDANSYTYTVANSGATASAVSAVLGSLRVRDTTDMTALSADKELTYTSPVAACRLNVTAFTSGFAELSALQAG